MITHIMNKCIIQVCRNGRRRLGLLDWIHDNNKLRILLAWFVKVLHGRQIRRKQRPDVISTVGVSMVTFSTLQTQAQNYGFSAALIKINAALCRPTLDRFISVPVARCVLGWHIDLYSIDHAPFRSWCSAINPCR